MSKLTTALLVMQGNSAQEMTLLLDGAGMRLISVPSCGQAADVLSAVPTVNLVVTQQDLPDGDWRRVMQEAAVHRPAARVVVCATPGDRHLWCELIQSGAYDVLPWPCERDEIRRLVQCAALTHASSAA